MFECIRSFLVLHLYYRYIDNLSQKVSFIILLNDI